MDEEIRLTIELDADLKYQFRLECMKNKTTMKEEIIRFIKGYLK